MNAYAQTNLQLYGQMLFSRRGEHELRLARDAYELALSLFAAQYRGNGKPFVAHLVGVASILEAHRHPIETITAGLLHSVYSLGEFGDGTRGINDRKRAEVKNAAGSGVEELVMQYTVMDWSLPALCELQNRAATLGRAHKAVLAIKAVDVVEDHLDRGHDYIPGKHFAEKTDNRIWMEALVDVTRRAGHAEIATELHALSTETSPWRIPDFLISKRSGSFLAAPRSHGKRMRVRMNRRFSRWLRPRVA